MPPNKDIMFRFWSRVCITDSCWNWTGAKRKNGYGQMRYYRGPGYCPVIKVHRFAYEMYFGPIPDGMCVLHHCDNPACVRPDHLFLGTQADNMKDMNRKGRHGKGPETKYGEDAPSSKLTSKQVIEMRWLAAQGYSSAKIAKMYGVAQQTAWDAIVRRTWKHL
jgi:hypothetical protein